MTSAHRNRTTTGEDFDAECFAQLYSKLAATVSATQTVGSRTDTLLSLLVPGHYLRRTVDLDDPQTQYQIANALDHTLTCSWVARPGPTTISDVYASVLDGKQTPLVQLTAAERAELDAARATLHDSSGTPTEAYRAYRTARLAYLAALDAFEQATATERNGGGAVPAPTRQALAAAARHWHEHGQQTRIGQALATVRDYARLDPAEFWPRLARQYRDGTRITPDGSQFQYVSSDPAYPEWFADSAWTPFTFDELDFERQERSGAVGVGDSGSDTPARYGGFHSAPSDFDGDNFRLPTGLPEHFRVTTELRRVEIPRPWLDPLVLRSRAWRWSPDSAGHGTQLSTGGNLAGSVVPRGVLPVLPTAALLARRVEIDWVDSSQFGVYLGARRAGGHQLRWGPFRLTNATIVGSRLSMPDPQLIGFICDVLPRCPDPDPRLPWPDSVGGMGLRTGFRGP